MNNLLKRIIVSASVIAMCLSFAPVSANASTTYKKGDVNGDGIVNSVDGVNLKQFLLGIKSADGKTTDRMDVSRDGFVDQNDVNALKLILLGSSSSTNVSYNSTAELPTQEDRSYYVFSANTGEKTRDYTLNAKDVSKITSTSGSTRTIIGDDDRVLEDSLKGVVNINNIGTGFVIDSHTILTAAHCLYSSSDKKIRNTTATNFTLYLYDDSTDEVKYNNKSVTATPVEFHIPAKYVSNYSSNYDYAIITVKEDLSDYMSFDLGVARSIAINKTISVTGFGGGNTTDSPTINPTLIKKMSTGSGEIAEIGNYRIWYDVDTINGDSGGPIYYTKNGVNTVIGIHTLGINSDGYNSGIRITTDILQFTYNNDYLDY